MDINIPENTRGEKETIVDANNTAKAYGSGSVDVYATPAMVALMESSANTSVEKHLPKGYISLGIEINVQHIKASPIGERITCISILEKQDNKKLYFRIKAFDSKSKIGESRHIRYIVEEKKFMEKLNQ